MKRITLTAFALVCAVLAVAVPLAAHHSFAGVFDARKVVRIHGVVTRFDWVNPHSYIYVDSTTPSGALEHWALEGPSVAQLRLRSVDRMTFKAGDTIQACGYRTKSQNPIVTETPGDVPNQVALAELLVLPDGRKMAWSISGPGTCLEVIS